jgi:hypothetical protein
MANAAPTTITRIVNEVQEGETPFTDNDFSQQTIERHKKAGYECAKRAIGGIPPAAKPVCVNIVP